jgi:uroporphyrinogen-III decarboxylase
MISGGNELYKQREERIQTTINLKTPDHVPVLCTECDFAWSFANISQYDFMFNNDKMMIAFKKFYDEFQTDAAYIHPILFHPLFYALEYPCQIKIPGEDLPKDSVFQVVEKEIMTEADYKHAKDRGYVWIVMQLLPKLRPEFFDVKNKFMDSIRLRFEDERTLANYKTFKEEWGWPLWYGGGMESPFSVLCLARSYKKLVQDIYRNPDIVKQTVKRFTQDIIKMSIGGCVANNVKRNMIGLHREGSSSFSLKIFEDIALPMIKEIVNAHVKENIITILHCDGDWNPNLSYLTELPKKKCVIDLDDSTDIFKAKEILGDRMCISGNVMERFLAFGTPQKVEDYCKKLIDVVGEGGGFILKGEAPRESKIENVKAMIKTANSYRVDK